LARRQRIYRQYRQFLSGIPGIELPPSLPAGVEYNYAYMVVQIREAEFGIGRDMLYEELKNYNIFTRRYFYPLLNDFACYQSVSVTDPLTVARNVASSILTLPIYDGLSEADVERICQIIKYIQARHDRKP